MLGWGRRSAVVGLAVVSLAATAAVALPSPAAASGMTFIVNSADDPAAGSVCPHVCTLRAAINAANLSPGADRIHFAIGQGGAHTISAIDALPLITEPVVLDASTQPGFAGTPLITLDGARTAGVLGSAAVHGLEITGGGSTIRGLVINGFSRAGSAGIVLRERGGNTVVGNYVGLDAAGASAAGNAGAGVVAQSADNVIGGTSPADRNVISGNGYEGLRICCGTTVHGNYIGTDASGEQAVPNRYGGILMLGGPGNVIGGVTPGAGNVISGNGGWGINTHPEAHDQLIQGNLIGTDKDGLSPLGNKLSGITLRSSRNVVGGPAPGASNIVSANAAFGIETCCTFGNDNRIQGNYVGTDITGTLALGNGRSGIDINSHRNVVGGARPGEGNLSSANGRSGIAVLGHDNSVVGNRVGTDVTGQHPLGNTHDGVRVLNGASRNVIGGLADGEANTIAFNRASGVSVIAAYVPPGTRNPIRGNRIFNNAEHGIDLASRLSDGITANDAADADEGGNRLQNWPVLTPRNGRSPHLHGMLATAPNAQYVLDLYSAGCDLANHGQGRVWLLSTTVWTDGSGIADLKLTLPREYAGDRVAATATDVDGNTSEFSNCG